ncbi:arginine--tRNA ligase [Aquimarina agarilytica]|uniref:arginine--tRNA ligase n=1 Tax=Aquimarina agarilytica TaxID=1087449 RepID=UPI000287F92F|nr:arginine--tRNA ligase [Aquimarina agarilytica]
MQIQHLLTEKVTQAVAEIFNAQLPTVEFQATRKEFEGDITVVVFSMLRVVKGNPVQIGEQIGAYLEKNVTEVKAFNVVKGFLNLVIADDYYVNFFNANKINATYGFVTPDDSNGVMVEYSSPNTNKPLHLGHVRNNLLGYAVAEILSASGKKVYKTQIINDRGVHICKSMLAWKKFGEGETPASTGLKGDKLVGNYYVKFDQEYKKEIEALIAEGVSAEEAKKNAPLLLEAQEMLRQWEQGDQEVISLWKMMNQWVYDGFGSTYTKLGVDFDKNYYESDTYKLGKDVVEDGLSRGIFYKKEDGSVWIDLTEEGLDEKLVLRSDGTSVYMTQDIGTAIQRAKDFSVKGMVYTVGNEQDYHFQVLFLILKKIGFSWAADLFHLSYGMVDLPSGKMKSREGTVVDADDLIDEMQNNAATISKELGKLDDYSEEQKQEVYTTIGLGALKYYILKVDPKKRILFDPEASIDFQGNTGPFIQYTYARIQAILRKAQHDQSIQISDIVLEEKEKEVLKQLELYPEVIQQAAKQYSPALIANYTYDLVKAYNSFFQNVPIFGADTPTQITFRVQLSQWVGNVIASGFSLLGIKVPERM